jgi:di/tricarboxylate transporter
MIGGLSLSMRDQSGDFSIYLSIFLMLIFLSVLTWIITKRDLLKSFIWVVLFVFMAIVLIGGLIVACNK